MGFFSKILEKLGSSGSAATATAIQPAAAPAGPDTASSAPPLPNRRLLVDRLNQVLAQGTRHGRSTAVLLLELDKLKEINDRLGHQAGDKLLHEVGARLKHCVRGEDTVSRIGDDEFVIVLPEISQRQDAEALAEKVIKTLSEPMTLAGRQFEFTANIGIAVTRPDVQSNAIELLVLADEAMYDAKQAGRNRYCFTTWREGSTDSPTADCEPSSAAGDRT